MAEHDGLKLLVRFYYNQGQLKMVAEKTGVPIKVLETWILSRAVKLSEEHRAALSEGIDPSYTGTVEVS